MAAQTRDVVPTPDPDAFRAAMAGLRERCLEEIAFIRANTRYSDLAAGLADEYWRFIEASQRAERAYAAVSEDVAATVACLRARGEYPFGMIADALEAGDYRRLMP